MTNLRVSSKTGYQNILDSARGSNPERLTYTHILAEYPPETYTGGVPPPPSPRNIVLRENETLNRTDRVQLKKSSVGDNL